MPQNQFLIPCLLGLRVIRVNLGMSVHRLVGRSVKLPTKKGLLSYRSTLWRILALCLIHFYCHLYVLTCVSQCDSPFHIAIVISHGQPLFRVEAAAEALCWRARVVKVKMGEIFWVEAASEALCW